MKIAFIAQPFDQVGLTQHGSIPIIAYQIARRLSTSNDIAIYGKWVHHQQKTQTDELGIHYHRISVDIESQLDKALKLFYRLPLVRNPKRPHYCSSLHYLGYALQVGRDLKKRNCEIAHIFNFSQFAPVIRAVVPDVKIVLHMQCEWLTQLDRTMIEHRLNKVDLILGCSEYIAEKIRQRFPQLADRCHAIYNGVDAEHFSSQTGYPEVENNDAKRLLFVGRVSPEKGVHVLLDAFQRVVERFPQAQLDIVGPMGSAPIEYMVLISDDEKVSNLASFYGRYRTGDYPAHLQKSVPRKLADQVSFVGNVPHSELIKYYQQADILVNPSLTEAFGMSLVEAMASEIPVVASRIGGMIEIIGDGEVGTLVESGNKTDLANALIDLLENETKMKSMGEAGRKRVAELYTWDQISHSLLHHYTELCKQPS